MEKLRKDFFKLQENGTTVRKEIVAGLTTFFTMVYIIFVNPSILSNPGGAGMPFFGVMLATIFAAVIGTLVMGLFANVPYAQAPGMGLNAFFSFTVCGILGFSWQEALAMVFICGVINVVITVTKIRKSIIKAIPKSLQYAIGGGIGVFIASIGFKNAGWVTFSEGSMNFTFFNDPASLVALFGVILTVVLLILKVKGAIIIGIGGATALSVIVHSVLGTSNLYFPVDANLFSSFASPDAFFGTIGLGFTELGSIFGRAFSEGMPGLFGNIASLPIALVAIFAFSLSDTFDTIGTFIGTGRASGIFSEEDIAALENSTGFKSKMDKALFADSVATSIGAVLGTSNTTTYIESAAGIEAGGRTGLTSVTTAIMLLLCIIISPIANFVSGAATAPALIVVGIMMMGSFKEINWHDLEEAIPAFFPAVLMAFSGDISKGIGFGFIFYVIVKLLKGKAKEIHPILYGASGLFLIYFILMALQAAGIFA